MTTIAAPSAAEAVPYLADFGLEEPPFRITPSDRYTYLTASTKEAILHCQHAIDSRGGLCIISGEIGLGKTSLAQRKVRDASDAGCSTAYLHRVPGGARQTESKILTAILDDLEAPSPKRGQDRLMALRDFAMGQHERGSTTVLVIDDAHKLRSVGCDVLLGILNLQFQDVQLVQVLLFGEFPEMMGVVKQVEALHSRLLVHTRLNPMTRLDVQKMVEHRLRIAGRTAALFTAQGYDALFSYSKGSPRKICSIANLACIKAWDADIKMVGHEQVTAAATALEHEAKRE